MDVCSARGKIGWYWLVTVSSYTRWPPAPSTVLCFTSWSSAPPRLLIVQRLNCMAPYAVLTSFNLLSSLAKVIQVAAFWCWRIIIRSAAIVFAPSIVWLSGTHAAISRLVLKSYITRIVFQLSPVPPNISTELLSVKVTGLSYSPRKCCALDSSASG